MISPVRPRRTASGLRRTRVRWLTDDSLRLTCAVGRGYRACPCRCYAASGVVGGDAADSVCAANLAFASSTFLPKCTDAHHRAANTAPRKYIVGTKTPA